MEITKDVLYRPIDEEAARMGYEAWNVREYEIGNKTSAYRTEVDEVLALGKTRKEQMDDDDRATVDT